MMVEVPLSGFWIELLRAFCLMLIIEGMVPFLYPARWRSLVQKLGSVDDRTLRYTGFISMLLGVAALYLTH
jgi:uncharacterized protein